MKKTKILCPNCFKEKLVELNKEECICEKCKQEFTRTGEMSVRFK